MQGAGAESNECSAIAIEGFEHNAVPAVGDVKINVESVKHTAVSVVDNDCQNRRTAGVAQVCVP